MDRLVAAGAPGTPLLAADAACAHLRPLRPFCAGKQSQAAVKQRRAGAAGTYPAARTALSACTANAHTMYSRSTSHFYVDNALLRGCAGELCAYMPAERDSQEQQLLYGRVTADARPPAGQPLHRVPLEVRLAVETLRLKLKSHELH